LVLVVLAEQEMLRELVQMDQILYLVVLPQQAAAEVAAVKVQLMAQVEPVVLAEAALVLAMVL
jgi:hypothetical protein